MQYAQKEVLFVESCEFWEEKGRKIIMDAAFQQKIYKKCFWFLHVFVVCLNYNSNFHLFHSSNAHISPQAFFNYKEYFSKNY